MVDSQHVAQGHRQLRPDKLPHQLLHHGHKCPLHAPPPTISHDECFRWQPDLDHLVNLDSSKSYESPDGGSHPPIHERGLRTVGQDIDEPIL